MPPPEPLTNRRPPMTALRPRTSLPAALVAFALLSPGALADDAAPTSAVVQALAAEPPLPDIVQGRADAPATIIEYASLTCPHCAAFHRDVWPALKAKYVDSGKAKFILREFPLDPLAAGAFMLARCAGDEKRAAVIDRLFDRQADWAFADDALARLKRELAATGMSEEQIADCLTDQPLYDKVKDMHAVAAAKLGVRSTPTFFVDGARLDGEHKLEAFDKILSAPPH
ncbi:MAG: DsbA family protein [Hyphomicrobiales bacterium]|nr:DsbA family protein [Hyphomicrobiales bacterium]